MFKILTLNKISPKGLDRFDKDRYEVASEFSDPDAIVLRSFKLHDYKFGPNLKAIARAGAGTNNIPVQKCTKEGIVVFNTPGANANAVKEIVIASMLLASRDIIGGVNWVNSLKGKGEDVPALVEQNKSNFAGNEIKGKTLGVIGLGAIGALVANDALSLGMKVIGYDPYISVDAAWMLSGEVEKATGLETLLKQVDYITIHVPLLDSTKEMINAKTLAMMKDGVSIINFSRGELVNNADIFDAIKNKKVKKYITDFPQDELLNTDGVIAIPHLGASTIESEENCAVMAVDEIKDFLENGNINNSVNFPQCSMPKCGNKRICITNENIPNMIGNITTFLANKQINIIDMLNKSRDEIAYNLIDIEGDISNDTLVELIKIEGIISVRLLD
ncbi:MAG: 3-phosphoglycerate dehydrogenase [Sulfurospirillum sp.]|nr:MAG: 3-phosphoglycerate dehydrogenase [Sulfurospirillum sp.]